MREGSTKESINDRGDKGAEGWKWGEGRPIPLPSRPEGLRERRELQSGVREGTPAEIEFDALYTSHNKSGGRTIMCFRAALLT